MKTVDHLRKLKYIQTYQKFDNTSPNDSLQIFNEQSEDGSDIESNGNGKGHTKYENFMSRVIMYDSNNDPYYSTPSLQPEFQYRMINFNETHNKNIAVLCDAENLSGDKDHSLKYFPNFYAHLGVPTEQTKKMRSYQKQSPFELY